MGNPTPVILKVIAPKHGQVIIETSDGKRYHTNLAAFEKVYCYPDSEQVWTQVSIDPYGLGLIWPTRFEVHVDQIIALADKIEMISMAS